MVPERIADIELATKQKRFKDMLHSRRWLLVIILR